MDPELKTRVRSDLESFLKGRAYYHRLGRVWRRSYLLYGPPGTGKSTFAAAMARFLGYDVYDIDLSRAGTDDLRALLLDTAPRSLILVEDLDRSLRGGDGEPSAVLRCEPAPAAAGGSGGRQGDSGGKWRRRHSGVLSRVGAGGARLGRGIVRSRINFF